VRERESKKLVQTQPQQHRHNVVDSRDEDVREEKAIYIEGKLICVARNKSEGINKCLLKDLFLLMTRCQTA
jgi:hypothetical protein